MIIQIPDHFLIRMIGKGSYGEVWLAKHSALGSYRAVKLIYRDRFEDARPFERELEGIKKFEPISRSHDGFIDILHVGINLDQGFFYYVMEIGDDVTSGSQINPDTYEAKTLEQVFKSAGRLNVHQSTTIGLAMTAALSWLHEHDLVHRDIKPANILYAGGVPKLADIGLVAQTNSQSSIVGTIGYMPPEGPGTAQADLYSLGKVLYEILTGNDRQHFPNLPPDLLVASQSNALVEFNEILIRACHPNPSSRYTDAWAMHAELSALANGKSIKRLRFLENKVKILKKWLAATVLGVLALSAFGLVYTREKFHQAEAKQREIGAQISLGTQSLLAGDYSQSLKLFIGVQNSQLKPSDNYSFRTRAVYQQTPKIRNIYFRNPELMCGQFHPRLDQILLGHMNGGFEVIDLARRNVSPPFFGLPSFIEGITYDPTGNFAASSSVNKGLQIWDLRNQELLPRSLKKIFSIHEANYSYDGNEIVVAGPGKAAVSYKLQDLSVAKQFSGHTGEVVSARFSHDGKKVLTTSRDGTARIYNAEDGLCLGATSAQDSWVYGAEFSFDDSLFITFGVDRTCRAYKVATCEEVFAPILHKDTVLNACFSPDGKIIATACLDSTVRFYESKTGRPLEINPILYHTAGGKAVSFNAEGNLLLSICVDGTVRIWDLASALNSGRKIFLRPGDDAISFSQHPTKPDPYSAPVSVRISPAGKYLLKLAVNSQQTNAHFYSTRTGKRLFELPLLSSDLKRVAFSEHDNFLSTFSDYDLNVHSLVEAGRLTGSLQATNKINKAFVSPKGDEIVTCSGPAFDVWDLSLRKCRLKSLDSILEASTVRWSTNYIVIGGRDAGITEASARVLDRQTGKVVKDLWHKDGILVVNFAGDEKFLITAGEDKKVCVWETSMWNRVAPPMVHPGEILDVACDTINNRLLTVCRDGKARVWDFFTGELLCPPVSFGTPLWHGRFISPDMIQVWDDGSSGAWFGLWSFSSDKTAAIESIKQASLFSEITDETAQQRKSRNLKDYVIPDALRTSSNSLKQWHLGQLREIRKERDPYAWNFHSGWVRKLEAEENR